MISPVRNGYGSHNGEWGEPMFKELLTFLGGNYAVHK